MRYTPIWSTRVRRDYRDRSSREKSSSRSTAQMRILSLQAWNRSRGKSMSICRLGVTQPRLRAKAEETSLLRLVERKAIQIRVWKSSEEGWNKAQTERDPRSTWKFRANSLSTTWSMVSLRRNERVALTEHQAWNHPRASSRIFTYKLNIFYQK